jgi:hypothetical protein
VIVETWRPNIGLAVIGDEVHEVGQLLKDHVDYFTFSLKELGQLRVHEVQNVMEDDNPIFK